MGKVQSIRLSLERNQSENRAHLYGLNVSKSRFAGPVWYAKVIDTEVRQKRR